MFDVEVIGNAAIVEVDDDLDVVTVRALEEAIDGAERRTMPGGRVVVSLERCTYCDSSSISVLLKAWRRMPGHFFTVVPRDGQCRRIFEITSIANQPFVVDDLPGALTALSI